jgi:hypothetical protein
MSKKSDKIMATATVAIALSAVIQGMLAFQQFSKEISSKWIELLALVVAGIFIVIAAVLAISSYMLFREV